MRASKAVRMVVSLAAVVALGGGYAASAGAQQQQTYRPTPANFNLTITTGGDKVGKVVSEPAGISCSNDAKSHLTVGTCTASFPRDSVITLRAVGKDSYATFSGDCNAKGKAPKACRIVVLDSDRNVDVSFKFGGLLGLGGPLL